MPARTVEPGSSTTLAPEAFAVPEQHLEPVALLGINYVRLADGSARAVNNEGQWVTAEAKPAQESLPKGVEGAVIAATTDGFSDRCLLSDRGELWCNTHSCLQLPALLQPPRTQGDDWCQLRLDPAWGASTISGTLLFGCALSRAGQVQCWDAARNQKPAPIEFAGRKIKQLEVSPRIVANGAVFARGGVYYADEWQLRKVYELGYVCALTDAGEVACFGDGSDGQLGVMGTEQSKSEPSADVPFGRIFASRRPARGFLPLSSPARQIFARGGQSCAWLENGQLWCWGNTGALLLRDATAAQTQQRWSERLYTRPPRKDGERGQAKAPGASTLPASPMRLPEDCELRQVSAGDQTICVLCVSGCAQCWDNTEFSGETEPDECLEFQ